MNHAGARHRTPLRRRARSVVGMEDLRGSSMSTGMGLGVSLLLAMLSSVSSFAGCGTECKVTSQCPETKYCDFDTHTCVQGCVSDEECGFRGTCEREHGICRAGSITLPRPDASAPDCGSTDTSTIGDADLACQPPSSGGQDSGAGD